MVRRNLIYLIETASNLTLIRLQLGSMKRVKQQMGNWLSFAKNHPVATISIAATTLIVSLLRRYHYKLVVHPDVGGRHNNQNSEGYRHPMQQKLASQEIEVPTDGNHTLRGWYVKHPKPTQIIIYFHQNAGNIGGRLFYIKSFLQNSNSNILLVAYRGFSDSDGNDKPNESQIMKDATVIFKKGIQISEKQKLPLFVFGRSLGGAAAIHVLSRPQFKYSAKGLILENTFTSVFDVANNFVPTLLFPFKLFLWLSTYNSFRSIDKMSSIHIPVLFIKGRRDEIVPTKLMDELQNECIKNKMENFSFEVENGTHNETWHQAGKQYFNIFNQFINHCSKI